MRRHKSRHAFTLVSLLVIIGIIALIIAIMLPALNRARETANRVKCASNLRQMGQALVMYANDNKAAFPRTLYTPGDTVIPDVTNGGFDSRDPFMQGNKVPANCVPSALFLLMRTEDITAFTFICPSSNNVADDFGGGASNAQRRSNFSDLSNLSYSYANPYPDNAAAAAGYKLTWTSMDPSFALAGDLNPGGPDLLALTKESPADQMRLGNSPNHNRDGQNTLYGDMHVEYNNNPFVGKNRDNIYIRGPGPSTDKNDLVNSPKAAGDSILLPAAQ